MGALLAQEWTEPWGSSLAAATSLSNAAARFFVATFVLFATITIAGYGASALLKFGEPSLAGRALGGWLGIFNGAFILSVCLRFVTDHLFEGQTVNLIDEGFLARVLRDGFDWVLLAGTTMMVLSIAIGMSLRLTAADRTYDGGREPARTTGLEGAPPLSRVRLPRVPVATDTKKVEPRIRRFDPETERFDADRPAASRRNTHSLATGWGDPARVYRDTEEGNVTRPSLRTEEGYDAALGESVVRDWLRRGEESSNQREGQSPDRESNQAHEPAEPRLPRHWRDISRRMLDQNGGTST